MSDPYTQAAEILSDADSVIVGASNGLSITEGLRLFAEDEDFRNSYPDVVSRYGARSILQACFAGMPPEDSWGFAVRLVGLHSLDYRPTQVMRDLIDIIGDRDYFVMTSNCEGHFTACGMPEDRVFEVEGNWRTMQCSGPCHPGIYPSMDDIARMRPLVSDGRVPYDSIPKCPECGRPMMLRAQYDSRFVPDPEPQARFSRFLEENAGRKVAVLELGIGCRNRLIKAPLMDLVARNPTYRYVTVNKGEVYYPDSIASRSVGIDDLLGNALSKISARMSRS